MTRTKAASKPQIHLICGPIGAGKTTLGQRLAASENAILFSIDTWMITLYGPDAPTPADPNWIFPRVARCEAQIWETAQQVLRIGTPVILDLGFQKRTHREAYRTLAAELGATTRLHTVDAGPEERWRRIGQRNAVTADTKHLIITRPMFDYVEALWEPPNQAERTANT